MNNLLWINLNQDSHCLYLYEGFCLAGLFFSLWSSIEKHHKDTHSFSDMQGKEFLLYNTIRCITNNTPPKSIVRFC